MLWTGLITGLTVSIIGILQYHNIAFTQIPSTGQPSATFGYRNFAAMYLIPLIPLGFLLFLQTKSKYLSIIAASATALMTVYLIYTRTRGAWGGLGFAIIAISGLILILPDFRKKLISQYYLAMPKYKIYLIIGSLLLTCLLAPLASKFSDTGLQRFDDKKSNIYTTLTSSFQIGGDRGRFQMWQNTLALISDYPLLGVGPGGWKRIYPPYDQGAMIRYNSSPVRPHNDYLWIAAEYGLLGLLCYLGFLLLIFRNLYHQSKDHLAIAACFAISLLAILGHSFFSFPKEHPQAMIMMYLLCGIICSQKTTRVTSNRMAYIMPLLIFFQATMATILCYKQIRVDHHYVNALVAEDDNDWSTVKDETSAGISHGAFRPHLLVIAGRSAEKDQRYDDAEAAYQRVLQLEPYNWSAHNGLGIIYKRIEKFKDSLTHYQEALKYFPGETNSDALKIRTNIGALYKSMGNLAGAEQEYRHILRIQPTNAGANNNMANYYKSQGELDSALVAYQTAIQTDSTQVQAHFNIADLYLKVKRPLHALKHAEIAATLSPNQAHILWGVGIALEANKRPADALQIYLLALEKDPEHHRTRFNLANLYFDLGEYAKAKHMYLVFIDSWQGDPRFTQFAKKRMIASEDFVRRMQK
ncbi:MAG: tetratricopeptide repeat protein [Candidatus Latescibacteria bacterium]|nr:tetratricopeptide repeat protein [Candidatus Latescibacterota bacterium]